MATIRSYTTIEQSRKLAEILPLESADMKWFSWKNEIDAPQIATFGYSKIVAESYKDTEAIYLPCWSLAALFDVLPTNLQIALAINDFQSDRKEKYAIGSIEHDKYDCFADNPVDACYEMILKLHEFGLL